MKTIIENLPGVLMVESDTALRQLLRSSICPPDAVILSMQLPDRDGVDFIRQLRL